MKRVRLWLLLFLCVLLPVRGAVAASMACAMPMPVPMQHHLPMPHPPMALHGEGHAHHQVPDAATPAHDKCNLCAASCCLTPLPSQPPAVAPPLEAAAAPFPAFDAPPVSFLSDGQERPPRSI